jgi:hypothetical protein
VSTTTTSKASTSTTPPPLAVGWRPIDVSEVEGHLGFPCCADTWWGEPSPPLPADGTSFADGDYFVAGPWPEDPTTPLELEVLRFEQCSLLPETACEPPIDEFDPAQLGIDRSELVAITIPLDEQLRVVLTGYTGSPDQPAIVEGTGTDLAEVASAIEASYWALLGSRIAAGEDAYAVVDDVRANPQGGFVDGLDGTGLSLSWLHDGVPPVLLQGPFRFVDDEPAPGRGTDYLRLPSIRVEDGRITLFVYAGYTP